MKKTEHSRSKDRPLMSYVNYNDSWFRVTIDDKFSGWQWGEGEYYDWCDANCSDLYNIVKYDSITICGRFKSELDAVLFKLRWM